MEKPKGVFGTGVYLGEIESTVKEKMYWDLPYVELMLKAALEKLHCCQQCKSIEEVREVIERPEWIG